MKKPIRRDSLYHWKVYAANMKAERDQYRERALAAEHEAAEWKRRFDALLERTPKVEA